MTDTGQQKGRFPRKYWAMLNAVLSGLLIPFASILIIILHNNVFFTFRNILRIHLDHPELFLLYILAIVSTYLLHIIYTREQKDHEYFQKIISKRDETIIQNAQFVNEIGKGNYSVHMIPEGEQDVLGKSLLAMKENLLARYRKESIQSWISEGKNVISNILPLYNELEELGDNILEHLIRYIDAIQGAIYLYNEEEDTLVSLSTYAYYRKKHFNQQFRVGFGLIGQCAHEKDYIYRTKIPDDYFTVSSGLLGEKKPSSLLIVPLISGDKLQGVVEIASLSPEIPEQAIDLVKEMGGIIARTIFNLRVNQKTQKLLQDSQKMAVELQKNEQKLEENPEEMRANQEQLQRFNEQLKAQIQSLENSQNRLQWLLENISEIIIIYDKDLVNIYVSPSVIRILGYSSEEYMNGKDFEGIARDDQDRIRDSFEMIIKDPSLTPVIQYNYIRKDGRKVSLESKFRNMLKDPAVNGIILNINNVTEIHRDDI